MKILVFCALGTVLAVLLIYWLVGQIRYRIGSRQLKVTLFGIPLRRISIVSIASISKRRTDGWAEHWWCTTRPKHRLLVLRRQSGLFRNFVITPKNRYVFKTELEKAMRRVSNGSSRPSEIAEEEEKQQRQGEDANGLISSDRSQLAQTGNECSQA